MQQLQRRSSEHGPTAWIEPGQMRSKIATDTSLGVHTGTCVVFMVIGPSEPQDDLQHDRTIGWWVLVNGRLRSMYLNDIGWSPLV